MKRENKIFWVFMILATGGIYVSLWFKNKSYLKHTKFTVGTITSDFHYKNTFGGAGYDYVFSVNNKKYSRTQSIGTFIKNNKYLVAYDSLNPKWGVLLTINLTDSTYVYPKNGWYLKEIPFKVDTLEIKKQIN